jgi:hypothetical protein
MVSFEIQKVHITKNSQHLIMVVEIGANTGHMRVYRSRKPCFELKQIMHNYLKAPNKILDLDDDTEKGFFELILTPAYLKNKDDDTLQNDSIDLGLYTV